MAKGHPMGPSGWCGHYCPGRPNSSARCAVALSAEQNATTNRPFCSAPGSGMNPAGTIARSINANNARHIKVRQTECIERWTKRDPNMGALYACAVPMAYAEQSGAPIMRHVSRRSEVSIQHTLLAVKSKRHVRFNRSEERRVGKEGV